MFFAYYGIRMKERPICSLAIFYSRAIAILQYAKNKT